MQVGSPGLRRLLDVTTGSGGRAVDDQACTVVRAADQSLTYECPSGKILIRVNSDCKCKELSELSGGEIAGIVFASLVGVSVCCGVPLLCLYCCLRRRRRRQYDQPASLEMQPDGYWQGAPIADPGHGIPSH